MKENKKKNPFLRFMGMGAQMLAPILVGIYLGKWLDQQMETEKAWTIGLTLFGVFSGMFLVIKEVISLGKDE